MADVACCTVNMTSQRPSGRGPRPTSERGRPTPERTSERGRPTSERTHQGAFFGVSAVLFALSAGVTIVSCISMSAMGGMPMPGGWTMSMAWMRMPEQTWFDAAASFLGMWIAMMVAMMLPCLVPVLWSYRQAIGRTGETRLGQLTTLVGIGYFLVWTTLGVIIYPLGVALAAGEMQLAAIAHAVPMAIGVAILTAGAFQFTTWKARHLACCRETLACRSGALRDGGGTLEPEAGASAWRYGLRLGIQCCRCCANLMLIPLLIGVMDLHAMAIATIAISVERLMPGSRRIRHGIGAVVIAMGLVLITRAATA